MGVVRPAIRLSRVDLPQPEWPINATNSPLATVRLMSLSAGNRPFLVLKVCSTPWMSMYLVVWVVLMGFSLFGCHRGTGFAGPLVAPP
ncbi:hypothetical protein Y695_04219 [Hydrogenophaga sp. T4]|nr:hypothetical protein Y695_04219 [Hydrogenophaga sp. T4]